MKKRTLDFPIPKLINQLNIPFNISYLASGQARLFFSLSARDLFEKPLPRRSLHLRFLKLL